MYSYKINRLLYDLHSIPIIDYKNGTSDTIPDLRRFEVLLSALPTGMEVKGEVEDAGPVVLSSCGFVGYDKTAILYTFYKVS